MDKKELVKLKTPLHVRYDPAMAYSYILDADNKTIAEMVGDNGHKTAMLFIRAINSFYEMRNEK